MPKFGLKCFIGSFLLSLVAIFATTKAYLVMSLNDERKSEPLTHITAQNIDLFASNEEDDPIYEKFNKLNQTQDKVKSNDPAKITVVAENKENKKEDIADILYQPDDNEGIILAENENNNVLPLVEKEDVSQALEENNAISEDESEISRDNDDEDEVQIADASTAPQFKIPLMHKYSNKKSISVSNEADDSQIALASDNVALKNLGTKNKKAQVHNAEFSATMTAPQAENDDPWEVAETANRHTGKNAFNANKKAAETEEEQPVPYKMQKNLLIPIPEDIMNEENLIPQFSSSEENLKLEEELRAQKKLPPKKIAPTIKSGTDDKKSAEDEFDDIDEETSKSLTQSISDWFSGNKSAPKISAKSNKDQNNSIFNKLLGGDKKKSKKDADEDDEDEEQEETKKEVIPTELKLAFQPNRAEISGQTLEWLHAFAENVVKYENVIIEIRISNTAPTILQQKRLKLLYRILANNGVDYEKINIIFTDREPNSFIIRNVRYATEEEILAVKKKALERIKKAEKKARKAREKAMQEAEKERQENLKKADNPWF
ncbi:MAG: hypothetical protein IKN67_01410 [Alphaproteobacteria bacterium]|nr:hypothetical protein [Alphaproteobacteria bacterium]